MKDSTLQIAVFVLLLVLFALVVLTSSWSDKGAGDQVSHLSDDSSVPIRSNVSTAFERTNCLKGNTAEAEFLPEGAPFAADIGRSSGDHKPKRQAMPAHNRENDLSEDEYPTDGKDDFVYTDDVVE